MADEARNITSENITNAIGVPEDIAILLAEGPDLSTREGCIEFCYRDDKFSDVTLVIGQPGNQRLYHLHKLVIAHQSPYLFKICSGNPRPGEAAPSCFIPKVDPQIFDHVEKWLYKAKLTDRDQDIPLLGNILEAAEYLKIKELSMKALENLRAILDRSRDLTGNSSASTINDLGNHCHACGRDTSENIGGRGRSTVIPDGGQMRLLDSQGVALKIPKLRSRFLRSRFFQIFQASRGSTS